VFGAVLGPAYGAVAELVGIRASFVIVGCAVVTFAAFSAIPKATPPEPLSSKGLTRGLRDTRFLAGLWLNTLAAFLFGVLVVLVTLALDEHGWSTLDLAALFFVTGLLEVVINPLLGRVSDRFGPLVPIRAVLVTSAVIAAVLAVTTAPVALAVLVCAAGVSFGGFYTPGMSLASHRADAFGIAQGLAFGLMNTAWALGALTGPTVGGALAEAIDDAVPYFVGAVLCALTFLATQRVTAQEVRPRAA
jgi:DHA2 family methylenomycin A resistance protein-like MFS transporter